MSKSYQKEYRKNKNKNKDIEKLEYINIII